MDQAVHGALIAFVCVCVCVCVREKTFLLRHESDTSLFLPTGSHAAFVRTPRESCSAQPGQSSDRPKISPHKRKRFGIFSFLSLLFGECPPKHSLNQGSKGSITQRANDQGHSSRTWSVTPLLLSFSTGALVHRSRVFPCSAVRPNNRDRKCFMFHQIYLGKGAVKKNCTNSHKKKVVCGCWCNFFSPPPSLAKKKKRPLRLCIKSKHCSYHSISA